MLKGVMQSGGKRVWADFDGLTDAHPLLEGVFNLARLFLRDAYGFVRGACLRCLLYLWIDPPSGFLFFMTCCIYFWHYDPVPPFFVLHLMRIDALADQLALS